MHLLSNTVAAKIELALEVAKKTFRDPDSAQFDCKWETEFNSSQKERYSAGGRILECRVRSKNGFGGYGNSVGYDFKFNEGGSKATIDAA